MTNKFGLTVTIFLGAILIFAGGIFGSDTDLSWVSNLVGFKSGVQTKTDEGIQIVYRISNGKRALGLIRKGLKARGWEIEKPDTVSVLTESVGVFVGTLTAYKGEATLEVSVQGAGGHQSLVMVLTGGTTPPPRSGTRDKVTVSTSRGESTNVQVTASNSGGNTSQLRVKTSDSPGKRIEIVENDVHKTIFCQGHVIEVMGNDCVLKITGYCKMISLPGNDNDLKVQGVIDRIDVAGHGNMVTWQASQDPQPKVSNMGTNNKFRTIE